MIAVRRAEMGDMLPVLAMGRVAMVRAGMGGLWDGAHVARSFQAALSDPDAGLWVLDAAGAPPSGFAAARIGPTPLLSVPVCSLVAWWVTPGRGVWAGRRALLDQVEVWADAAGAAVIAASDPYGSGPVFRRRGWVLTEVTAMRVI